VKRAVDTAFEKADEAAKSGRSIYTFGPVIHNEEVIKKLEEKGVRILNSLDDIDKIPSDSLIILRSHGVGKSVI
jgi:Penicillin tolerance protein